MDKNMHHRAGDNDRHVLSLFATERIEDYVVLSLALFILIIILAFH